MSSKAIEPGQRVELKIRGLGSTSGNVETFSDTSVRIALVVDPGADAKALGDPDATLEFPSGRGVYRQEGFARFDGAPGSVCFVSREEAKLVQRREFARVDVRLPVIVKVGGWAATTYETENLSANGLLLRQPLLGAEKLELGTVLWVELDLGDGEEPVEARGTVVRAANGGAVGVRYDHIREEHQERLVRFVFKTEIEQRRKALD
ncbi:MAG TPA: PilZ domain-containing protein [Thermoleophilaceae bacterium]|nr:PilZ domain-containing protein [Thermoleophilaceae bacterium]